MPHLQVKTSPGGTSENVRRVANVLATGGLNIDGIGPDFDPPHIRTVVNDDEIDAAVNLLNAGGLQATVCRAIYVELPNTPGALDRALARVARLGCTIESVLVLASRGADPSIVRLSIGVRDCIVEDWDSQSSSLRKDVESAARG